MIWGECDPSQSQPDPLGRRWIPIDPLIERICDPDQTPRERATPPARIAGPQVTARIPRQPEPCRNCGSAPAYAHGRCRTCAEYFRRTGEERPERLIVRAGLRALERRQAGRPLAAAR